MYLKTRTFAFRIAEQDYALLKTKSKRAKITMTDFIIRCVTDKEIIVVDDLTRYLSELKGIGRNLNQLTVLANMGRISNVQLTETKEALDHLYDSICRLTGEKAHGHS